ncbi:MAG: NADH-quinone oxidoreductase subunit NuoE [bacterium]
MKETPTTPEIALDKLGAIIGEFKGRKWALIPMLQRVQDEYGYIPEQAIEPVAEAAGLFPSQVYGVVTFYSQFYTAPRGRNLIRVCRGTACHVRGGRKILQAVERELGIRDGETTTDFKYSLETVACLGTCFLAPVMMMNRLYFGRLVPQKVNAVLKQF